MCGNRISGAKFLIVFHSNYGSILLSFRDMTTGRTTDDVRTTAAAAIAHLARLEGQLCDAIMCCVV